MKRIGGLVGIAVTAYYALMLLLYLGREVHGGNVGRVLRSGVVAYYGLMIIAYLKQEVLSGDGTRAEPARPAHGATQEGGEAS